MFIRNNKRFDVHGAYVIDGESFGAGAFLNQEIRNRMNVTMVEEPEAPEDYSPDTYHRTEQDDAPYVVYTRKSDEEIMALMVQRYEQALDNHLDAVAKQYRYNDRFTFALRAGYAGPWQADGVAFAQWMDTCNASAFALMEQVLSGDAPAPTVEEFIAGLPEFSVEPNL